jgi:hypothetical protein
LPDHDWAQHKLIPSVYAGIAILSNGLGKGENVTCSGRTYIAIRSGKHLTSTAISNALGFEQIIDLKEFNTITRHGSDRLVKPFLVFTVDQVKTVLSQKESDLVRNCYRPFANSGRVYFPRKVRATGGPTSTEKFISSTGNIDYKMENFIENLKRCLLWQPTKCNYPKQHNCDT